MHIWIWKIFIFSFSSSTKTLHHSSIINFIFHPLQKHFINRLFIFHSYFAFRTNIHFISTCIIMIIICIMGERMLINFSWILKRNPLVWDLVKWETERFCQRILSQQFVESEKKNDRENERETNNKLSVVCAFFSTQYDREIKKSFRDSFSVCSELRWGEKWNNRIDLGGHTELNEWVFCCHHDYCLEIILSRFLDPLYNTQSTELSSKILKSILCCCEFAGRSRSVVYQQRNSSSSAFSFVVIILF